MNEEELEFQALVGTQLAPLGWRYDELIKALEAGLSWKANGNDYFPMPKLPDSRKIAVDPKVMFFNFTIDVMPGSYYNPREL